jgi:hypothetical protein
MRLILDVINTDVFPVCLMLVRWVGGARWPFDKAVVILNCCISGVALAR